MVLDNFCCCTIALVPEPAPFGFAHQIPLINSTIYSSMCNSQQTTVAVLVCLLYSGSVQDDCYCYLSVLISRSSCDLVMDHQQYSENDLI